MPSVKCAATVVFDHPIVVELARHPRPFRVKGVTRDRNPNGLRGLFSYAIAEWQMPGSGNWLPVRDLVQQMRLANTVEHELGRNPQEYANVDGDRVVGVTEYDYRIVFYTPRGKTVYRYPASPEADSVGELSHLLDELVAQEHATGGDIEMFVDGFGWCVNNEEIA